MTFTIDEIMDALSVAFANTHPRTWRDTDIETAFKEALTRRAGERLEERAPAAVDADNGGF